MAVNKSASTLMGHLGVPVEMGSVLTVMRGVVMVSGVAILYDASFTDCMS